MTTTPSHRRSSPESYRSRSPSMTAPSEFAGAVEQNRYLPEGGSRVDAIVTIAPTGPGRDVGDLVLRLWTPRGASVQFVKQVWPTVEDLIDQRTEAKPQQRVGDYPLGTWGPETRDYHVAIEVVPGAAGDEMLAARVSIVRPDSGDELGRSFVTAIWTEDTALSTRTSP